MRKRNKLFSLLFVAILVCACVFPMLFAFVCTGDENDPDTKYFYCYENNVRYVCKKENKTAYVCNMVFGTIDKDTGNYIPPTNDDSEIIVIPETIKNGEYKVVALGTFNDRGMTGGYTNNTIAPKSWKNIKKIYLPYTIKTMYGSKVLAARESAFYEGRFQLVVPNLDAEKGAHDSGELFNGNVFTLYDSLDYILAIVPQKHYDMVVEQYGTLETPPTVEEYVQNLVTPNYVFNFNYEGAPNEGIYWIDLIEDEKTVFVLPTNPTREGYTFGGWYMEEDCITEWDSKMTPTAKVKNMYAKWIPAETEQPTESEETAE